MGEGLPVRGQEQAEEVRGTWRERASEGERPLVQGEEVAFELRLGGSGGGVVAAGREVVAPPSDACWQSLAWNT